jgi:hypothetical protein
LLLLMSVPKAPRLVGYFHPTALSWSGSFGENSTPNRHKRVRRQHQEPNRHKRVRRQHQEPNRISERKQGREWERKRELEKAAVREWEQELLQLLLHG